MNKAFLNFIPTKYYLNLRRLDYKLGCKEEFYRLQSLRKGMTKDGYSFEPFDKHAAIFVHIPKCAGISLNNTLFGNLAGGHRTFDDYLTVFEAESIISYFKFTIVRNPWDRLVSAYFFLKKGGFNQRDKAWFDKELGHYDDFEEFVKKWLSRENIWRFEHFRPQSHYIFDKYNKISMDFVGFFENLNEDFNYIAEKVGVSQRLPRYNVGKHQNYQDYYTKETMEIVSHVYEKDIKLFGYDFKNTTIKQQIRLRDLTGSKFITQYNR